jgi:tRNA threonylcarbamoyl adenosine modification protein YeaZ
LLILGIDTTEKNIHIALTENDILIAEIEEKSNKTEETINYFDKLFKSAGKKAGQLSAIGVITGPGGYTGTRAGVSVAKTMSQFLKVPVFGINKLEAFLMANENAGLVAAAVDIKKNEVYACIGSVKNSLINYTIEPGVFSYDKWIELLMMQNEGILFPSGDFILKKDLFNSLPANIKPDYQFFLKPSHICYITKKLYESGQKPDFKDVSPLYIREAI